MLLNSLAETLSIIEPSTMKIYSDVISLGIWPNDIVYWSGKIYVVNSGDNSITVYDESTLKKEGDIYLGKGANPWSMAIAPKANRGYVSNFAAGQVAEVDLKNKTLLKKIDVGRGPEGLAYLNGKIYVCNSAWNYQTFSFDPGSVSVIDTVSGQVIKTIPVPQNPQGVIALPELEEVHIICTGKNGGPGSDDGKIVIVDAKKDQKVGQLDIGGSPGWGGNGIDWQRKIIYLTGMGGLMSYNYQTRKIIHPSSNYLVTGQDPNGDFYSGVVVDITNNRLFVCHFNRDKILVLERDEPHRLLTEIKGSDGVQLPLLVKE